MLDKVLFAHFVMMCAMWNIVVSRARLNDVRSIPSQSSSIEVTAVWRFLRDRLGEIIVDLESVNGYAW